MKQNYIIPVVEITEIKKTEICATSTFLIDSTPVPAEDAEAKMNNAFDIDMDFSLTE